MQKSCRMRRGRVVARITKTPIKVRSFLSREAFLAVVLGAMLAALQGCRPTGNTLTLNNKSTQAVTWVTVQVCGQHLSFANLPPGASSATNFGITGDSGFVVTGAFVDGTTLQGSFGYVTRQLARASVRVDLLPDGKVSGSQ